MPLRISRQHCFESSFKQRGNDLHIFRSPSRGVFEEGESRLKRRFQGCRHADAAAGRHGSVRHRFIYTKNQGTRKASAPSEWPDRLTST